MPTATTTTKVVKYIFHQGQMEVKRRELGEGGQGNVRSWEESMGEKVGVKLDDCLPQNIDYFV